MTLELLHSEFLIYEENFFSFLSVHQVIYLSQSSCVSLVELSEGITVYGSSSDQKPVISDRVTNTYKLNSAN
jgi:hypothetical protein